MDTDLQVPGSVLVVDGSQEGGRNRREGFERLWVRVGISTKEDNAGGDTFHLS